MALTDLLDSANHEALQKFTMKVTVNDDGTFKVVVDDGTEEIREMTDLDESETTLEVTSFVTWIAEKW